MRKTLLIPIAAVLAFLPSAPATGGTAESPFALPEPTGMIVAGGVSRDPYVGAISMDASTGEIFVSDHADRPGYPASTTKLMTLLLVLEDIESGRCKTNEYAEASQFAAAQIPSSVGLRPGQKMTVDDLLMALMVKSANDAAVVLAEHAEGSVAAFVARMNRRAAQLGMTRTRFESPNGLSPDKVNKRGFDISTAHDLAILACEIVKHPQTFRYTSRATASVTDGSGNPLVLQSHNRFLTNRRLKIPGVDGLKTGYTDKGGSSIVLTAKRGERRVIAVVLGSSSRETRETEAHRLISDAADAVSLWQSKNRKRAKK